MKSLHELLTDDETEHYVLSRMMGDLVRLGLEDSDALETVFTENERLKSRWGGKTPGAWRSEARECIADVWKVKKSVDNF